MRGSVEAFWLPEQLLSKRITEDETEGVVSWKWKSLVYRKYRVVQKLVDRCHIKLFSAILFLFYRFVYTYLEGFSFIFLILGVFQSWQKVKLPDRAATSNCELRRPTRTSSSSRIDRRWQVDSRPDFRSKVFDRTRPFRFPILQRIPIPEVVGKWKIVEDRPSPDALTSRNVVWWCVGGFRSSLRADTTLKGRSGRRSLFEAKLRHRLSELEKTIKVKN